MTRIGCPSDDELRAFALGELPEPTLDDIAAHFEECPACESRAQRLDTQSDPFVSSLRRFVPKGPQVVSADPSSGRSPTDEDRLGAAGRILPVAPGNTENETPHSGGTSSDATPSGAENTPTPEDMGLDFLEPPREPDEIGWLGQFRIIRLLGRGGMGMVFQAEDTHLRRIVALKLMRPERAEDMGARLRFLQEARAAAKLHHGHIVTVFQVGQVKDVPFLAMEFLEGQSLEDRLDDGPPPTLSEIVRIGCEVAEGLAVAHAAGLIHRDIKPANVWLETVGSGQPAVGSEDNLSPPLPFADCRLPTVTGASAAGSDDNPPSPPPTAGCPLPTASRAKILDFGLARNQSEAVRLTQSGMVVGTPAYMAPEQARGAEVDHRCDLFALGHILYQMCTGRAPFSGIHTMALLTSLALDEPPPPRETNPVVPVALSELVMRMLAKKPDDRPASARVVAESLRAIERELAAGPPVLFPESPHGQVEPPRPAGPTTGSTLVPVPLGRTRPRRRLMAVAAMVLVGGLLIPFVAVPWFRPADTGAGGMASGPGGTRPGGTAPATTDEGKGAFPGDPLDASTAPPLDRRPWDPVETVTVLGDRRPRHWARVLSLAYSPNGKLLAAANGHLVHLWDAETGQMRVVLAGHASDVVHVAFAADGTTLASGTAQREVKIWETATGKLRATYQERAITFATTSGQFAYNGSLLAAGNNEGEVIVWDAATGDEKTRWRTSKQVPVRFVTLSADGKTMGTVNANGTTKAWDVASRKEIAPLKGLVGESHAVAMSADGGVLAALVRRGPHIHGEFLVWNVRTGELQASIRPDRNIGKDVLTVSGDGKRILTDYGPEGQVWDATTGKPIVGLRCPIGGICSLALTADGKSAALAGMDGAVELWDAGTGQEGRQFGRDGPTIEGLSFAPDGKYLALAGSDGVATTDLASWQSKSVLKEGGKFKRVAIAPKQPLLAALATNGPIWFRELSAGNSWRARQVEPYSAACLAYAPDGLTVAADSRSVVQLWNAVDGNLSRTVADHPGTITALAFAPDGNTLATAGLGSPLVRFWTVASGKEVGQPFKHPGHVIALAYSADGKFLASGTSFGDLTLWEIATGNPQYLLRKMGQHVYSLAFSRDGTMLAMSTYAGRVMLFDLPVGQKRNEWTMPGPMTQVEFSSSGRFLATVNGDGTVSLLRITPKPVPDS